MYFLIVIGIIFVIAFIKAARHERYMKIYRQTHACPKCGGKKMHPIVQPETFQGTTVRNKVRLVCTSCFFKL